MSDPVLPAPVLTRQVNFQGMTPEEIQAILSQNMGYARQTVTTGPALQNALANRTRGMADTLAQQYNQRGQGMDSGVFQSALAQGLANAGSEAELSQQQALSQAGQNMFSQGRGELYGQRSAEYGGEMQRALGDASAQNEYNLAEYTNATNAAREKKNRKRGLAGTIGSVVGGVGGFLLGGPLGAAAGSQLGGGVGEYAGG